MYQLYAERRIVSKMPHFTDKNIKKVIGLVLSLVLIFFVVGTDPDGFEKERFDEDFSRSGYFENCERSAAPTSTDAFLDVVDVADGDTITVSRECEPVTVRLIGVDTPETVDPRKPMQCFGKEASDFTKSALKGKKVKIETDDSQDTFDKYGRLLGYVRLEDGTNFNLKLLEEGYAYEYTYEKAYRYQKEFKEAEVNAKADLKGLWGEKCKK